MSPNPSTPPLLSVQGLVKRYGGVIAVQGISLELQAGQVLGVIGPNGAGKSTLVGLLSGALLPSEGRVVYAGLDITGLPAPERARRGIGRTHQIPRPFLDMTVRENLLAAHYAVHPLGNADEAHEASERILARTGLLDAAERPARALPLLRRKRLEVARALALKPRLLLLDEVGAGLVHAEVTELIELIRALRDEVEGIIIIEHVLRVVRACCDRLMVINLGQPFAEGPTQEVLASDKVATIYLGSPNAANPEHGPSAARPDAGSALDGLTRPPRHAPDAPPLLELRDVSAGYGQARVLSGIGLRVHEGQAVAVLGTNGAGKSTLANVISGVLAPTRGQLLVDGHDMTGQASHRITARGISQVMEGRRIFANLSVEENLLLTATGISRGEATARLEQVYALFPDLQERRKLGGTSMSGGQQQMLAIARALMSRPRLILFDEISLGLAPVMMDRLYAALSALKRAGMTMMIVEQDVERALVLADHVVVIEHGSISFSGTAEALRSEQVLRELYVGAGVPQ